MMLLTLWCCTENSVNLMHCRVVSLVVLGYGNAPIISSLGPIGFVRLVLENCHECRGAVLGHIQGCAAHCWDEPRFAVTSPGDEMLL